MVLINSAVLLRPMSICSVVGEDYHPCAGIHADPCFIWRQDPTRGSKGPRESLGKGNTSHLALHQGQGTQCGTKDDVTFVSAHRDCSVAVNCPLLNRETARCDFNRSPRPFLSSCKVALRKMSNKLCNWLIG